MITYLLTLLRARMVLMAWCAVVLFKTCVVEACVGWNRFRPYIDRSSVVGNCRQMNLRHLKNGLSFYRTLQMFAYWQCSRWETYFRSCSLLCPLYYLDILHIITDRFYWFPETLKEKRIWSVWTTSTKSGIETVLRWRRIKLRVCRIESNEILCVSINIVYS
jgi:hypothetical protein